MKLGDLLTYGEKLGDLLTRGEKLGDLLTRGEKLGDRRSPGLRSPRRRSPGRRSSHHRCLCFILQLRCSLREHAVSAYHLLTFGEKLGDLRSPGHR